jgi:hypothetical protein
MTFLYTNTYTGFRVIRGNRHRGTGILSHGMSFFGKQEKGAKNMLHYKNN